jgi:PEP-CTERM motif
MRNQVSVLRSFKLLSGTLALLFSLPLFLNAGTITFLDLSDTTTYVDDTGRAPNLNCATPESCFGNLSAPAGLHAQPGGLFANIMEPGTTSVSDRVARQGSDPSFVQLQFTSDCSPTSCGADSGLNTCIVNGGCSITEDGTVQTAFTLNWLDANGNIVTTDTIKFQSDVSEVAGVPGVPEPSALLLVGIGGAAILLVALRKRTVCHRNENRV